MLQILHQFLPGSLTSAVVNATLAIGTCCLVMVAQPGSFVPLFILSFASFSAYLPVIGLLADKERRKSDKTRHVKRRGIELAKNQFILTFLHGIIWTVFIGIFMADLVKLPMSFTCPSKQCVTYTLAMTVAYFNLFVICAQLAALTEIVCQVQSCPSRVLADRTLGHILRKSISQLISLRQEGKRVKAMGAETQSTERGEVRHMTETTRDLVLADINLAEPRDENRNRRRRTRTTSGNGTITNKSRHHRSITLGDLAAVVQYDSQGGARNPFSGTRNPFSNSEKVHRLEDHSADLYGMIPTARRVAALKTGQPKTPPNFSRPTSPYSTHSYNSGLRAISPAQPESFIMPYTPMSILQSPDSRYSTYSRWSADVTPTSRHSKTGMEGSPDSLVGETVKTPTG